MKIIIYAIVLVLAIAGCQSSATVVEEQQTVPQITVLEPSPQVNTVVFQEVVSIKDGKADIETVIVPLNTQANIIFVNENKGNESSVRLVSADTDVYLRAKEQYTLSVQAQEEPTLIYYEIDDRLGSIQFQ